MTETVDACPLAPSLLPLTERVAKLEVGTEQIKQDVAGVKSQVEAVKTQLETVNAQAMQVVSDTAAIRAAILGASRVGTFIKRHGGKAGGTALGIAIGSGFFSEATIHKLRIILVVLFGGH